MILCDPRQMYWILLRRYLGQNRLRNGIRSLAHGSTVIRWTKRASALSMLGQLKVDVSTPKQLEIPATVRHTSTLRP